MTVQQVIDKYSDAFGSAVSTCGISADLLDSGYAKFRADGTWQIDEMTGAAITYSEKCLAEIGQTCNGLKTYSPTDAATSRISKKCESANGTCSCSFMFNSDPDSGSYTTDGTSYHLYNEDGSENAIRGYCIQGDTISVMVPGESFSGEGVVIATRSTEKVIDIDASITLPKFDASADKPIPDASVDRAIIDTSADKPKLDTSVDKPKTDTAIDAPACTIAKACTSNSDCSNGLTCQKFTTLDGQSVSSKICMPTQCTTCGSRSCAYNPDPKICGFVECKSEDAGVTDTKVAPIDATPVAYSDMPASMGATCPKAAAAPCGGDLIGDWEVLGICDKWLGLSELLDLYGGTCPTWGDYNDSGTAFFRSDGSCLISEYGTYQIDKSESCLKQNNMSCASMNQTFKDAVTKGDMAAGGCALSGGDKCHCEKSFSQPDDCKYITAGNSITTVSNDGSGSWGPNPYCVEGDTLTIFFTPWSAAGKSIGGKAGLVMRRKAPVDAGIDTL